MPALSFSCVRVDRTLPRAEVAGGDVPPGLVAVTTPSTTGSLNAMVIEMHGQVHVTLTTHLPADGTAADRRARLEAALDALTGAPLDLVGVPAGTRQT